MPNLRQRWCTASTLASKLRRVDQWLGRFGTLGQTWRMVLFGDHALSAAAFVSDLEHRMVTTQPTLLIYVSSIRVFVSPHQIARLPCKSVEPEGIASQWSGRTDRSLRDALFIRPDRLLSQPSTTTRRSPSLVELLQAFRLTARLRIRQQSCL